MSADLIFSARSKQKDSHEEFENPKPEYKLQIFDSV
jgi:hypothetical protein